MFVCTCVVRINICENIPNCLNSLPFPWSNTCIKHQRVFVLNDFFCAFNEKKWKYPGHHTTGVCPFVASNRTKPLNVRHCTSTIKKKTPSSIVARVSSPIGRKILWSPQNFSLFLQPLFFRISQLREEKRNCIVLSLS